MIRKAGGTVRTSDDGDPNVREVLERGRSFGWPCEFPGCEDSDTRTVHEHTRRAPETVRFCRYHLRGLVVEGAEFTRPGRHRTLTAALVDAWWRPDNEVRDVEDKQERKAKRKPAKKQKPARADPVEVETVDPSSVEGRILDHLSTCRTPASQASIGPAVGVSYFLAIGALARLAKLGKAREVALGRWQIVRKVR